MTFDRRLHAIFEAVFGSEISELSDEDSPSTIKGWDSLNHVHLVLALEDEFDVRFDADEIADLVSVGAIRRRLSDAHGEGTRALDTRPEGAAED